MSSAGLPYVEGNNGFSVKNISKVIYFYHMFLFVFITFHVFVIINFKIKIQHLYIFHIVIGNDCGVTFIIIGNGHGNLSLNLQWGLLHFT